MSAQPRESSAAHLSPIRDGDIPRVARFLHEQMNDRFSVDTWMRTLSQSWIESPPNRGFMLEDVDRVVGVICALYSQQTIAGETFQVSNPHSWCVLPGYRRRSVDLVLAVIRQKGYHFTMFSPNSSGIEIFSYLKF